MTILITGATGNVGLPTTLACRRLVPKATLRAATIQPSRLSVALAKEGVVPCHFDFGQPDTWPAALQGVEALFLFRPPQLSQNKALELTRAQAYTYTEVAAILSQVLGRPVRYDHPGAMAFLWHHHKLGTPLAFSLVMLAIYNTARLGKAAGHSPELESLLGCTLTHLSQFAIREKAFGKLHQ